VLSFERNKGDDAEDGNEHFSPSSIEDNLGDDLYRLLNSSSSVSPLNGTTQNHEQDEDDLVDYDEEDDEEDIIRNEKDKTMSARTFADNHTEVEAHDNTVAKGKDKLGDDDFAQSESKESTPEGQPKEKDREVEAQEGALQLAEINANTPVAKPVLTQKGIMDIISKQPHALMQKMEWEQKKQCCKEMLSGYESPNGTSINVAVDLTALMFVSAVSENAQMISRMAQSEASDKLMKQAEQHRDALEKEFNLSMERMKAEHDRAITEAMKIRDNYARSAHEAASAVNQTMLKIDQVQSDNVVNFQLETLKKGALKYELQLQETTEKYEEEMKELLFDKQRKEFLNERKKNKELEKELRVFENSVINGSALPKEMTRKSPDSSPEVPNPKRARVGLIEDAVAPLAPLDSALKRLAEKTEKTKSQSAEIRAYNKRVIEDINVEPAKAITHEERRLRGQNLIERARVLMEDETKIDDVVTSAYSQSLRDNANLLVMTKVRALLRTTLRLKTRA
jgi:hypothetical protein